MAQKSKVLRVGNNQYTMGPHAFFYSTMATLAYTLVSNDPMSLTEQPALQIGL
jgi:hypothetical protein